MTEDKKLVLVVPDYGIGRVRARSATTLWKPVPRWFGEPIGPERVYVHHVDPGSAKDSDGGVYLMELGPGGRRQRQIAIEPGAQAIAEAHDDLAFNSPFDLYDPKLAMQIDSREFEVAWLAARPADGQDT